MAERKPIAANWTIKEQIIKDIDLVLQFEVLPNGDQKLRLIGDALTCGNREFFFDKDGHQIGTGTHIVDCPKLTWRKKTTASEKEFIV